jgi:hypothetical protein
MFRKLNSDAPSHVLRLVLIVSFILLAASVRILPHPWNFTPIGAISLFSGAKLNNRFAAFLVPLTALFPGDLFVGLYKLMIAVYLSFCISVFIGRYIRLRQTLFSLSVATLLGSVQFFLVTNFAIWAAGLTSYAKSTAGLINCYVAGIPLFGNTIAGDAFYSVVLFGGFALAERLSPALRSNDATVSV